MRTIYAIPDDVAYPRVTITTPEQTSMTVRLKPDASGYALSVCRRRARVMWIAQTPEPIALRLSLWNTNLTWRAK